MPTPNIREQPLPRGLWMGPTQSEGAGFILYAEDNLTDATFFIRALTHSAPDAGCIHLENGSLAQHFLEDCIQDEKELPRLVVLDIKMPGLSGLDLLEYIRGTPRLSQLPVIILSASAEPRDLHRAYDNDINAYLIKPNRYRDLNELIKVMVTIWIKYNQVPT